MAAQSNLVLNNGASTPVAKTFTPLSGFGGASQPAVWLLKEGVSPMAYARVEVGMRRNGNGTTKIHTKVIVPYVVNDPATGPRLVSKAIYDSQSGGFTIPENATIDQINDLEAFVKNLHASTMLRDWVRNFDPAY